MVPSAPIRRLTLSASDTGARDAGATAPRQQAGVPVDRPGETSVSMAQAAAMLRDRGKGDLADRLRMSRTWAAQALDS